MAKKTIKLSLRFVFNRKTGTTQKAFGPNTARFVAREAAILVADEMWDLVALRLRTRLIRDGNREISAIAQQFKRYIVGIDPNNNGAYGRLQSAAAREDGTPVSQSFRVNWDRRSESYLERKKRELGHTRWFQHGGGLTKGQANPVSGQLQNQIGRTATWTRAFGPVGVRVSRKSRKLEGSGFEKSSKFDPGPWLGGGNVRLQIASVTVYAFGRITPAMLSAIGNEGGGGAYPDGRTSGLIGLLPPQLAYRLGGNRKHVPYRPTLEPFLEFFLTRSLPNAVTQRLEQGMMTKL